ncbi:MAG: tyrosine--tRNA ligase [Bacteroidetes bacterium]|nr:tyrosine--tRNA ligase [Bacteroidota bacterium]
MVVPLNEQMDIILSDAAEVLPQEELARKVERSIKTNKQLIVKLGCDPSRPDLHIGHAVVLRKMRQFQDLGHQAILIVGDFTGMIGDPTGKSKTRPALSLSETRDNGKSYFEQAAKILSMDNLKMCYNSEWLSEMSFTDVIHLSGNYTVAQMLERDDFSKRFKTGEPISIHEFLYPLAQAMDSVAIKSDVELGGTDQKFNLMVGRDIQRAYQLEPQCIVIMPILEGTDGIEKMSKSLGNYIGLTDTPQDMFGKTMSIPDSLISRWYQYAANFSKEEADLIQVKLNTGDLHPRTAKVELGIRIASLYHGEESAQNAFKEFEKIFVKKDVPDNIEDLELKSIETLLLIVDVLVIAGLATSKNEARRLIQGGGVSVDSEKISDVNFMVDLSSKKLFKVGKRKFLNITVR